MSDPVPPVSSPSQAETPPPLPHKVRLFKIACQLGFWAGIIQFVVFLLVFAAAFFTRGGPLPLLMFVAAFASILEALFAWRISQHRKAARGLFTAATIGVSFFYLTLGMSGFLFAVINAIPLLLLVLSSSPDAVSTAKAAQEQVESGRPLPANEDLY